jgi:LacI family transcriptional regulator
MDKGGLMTLKELATRLGLSVSTVSRALNGYADVAGETRERVITAARAFRYTPNAAAQRLITGRAHAVGYVLPLPQGRFADPFFMELMIGLGEGLRPAGLDLVVCAAEPGEDELATYRRLIDGRRVDIMVLARTRVDDERIELLRSLGFPFVTHGRWRGPLDFDSFECDNVVGGRLAGQLLIGLGHRRLMMLGAPGVYNYTIEREAGFREATIAAGARVDLHESADAVEDEGHRVMLEALGADAGITAVFCANDRLAIGAMRAAHDLGREVGLDLALIGYDDLPFSGFADPPLTTIRQPIRASGRRVAEMVIARLAAPSAPPTIELWRPDLVLRASHDMGAWRRAAPARVNH